MTTVNQWYVFNDPIDKKLCDDIRGLVPGQQHYGKSSVDVSEGITEEERKSHKAGEFATDKKVRVSDVAWTSEQWVYDLIWPYMKTANDKSGWKYDITSAEAMQITRYKKGGFYTWHRDGNHDHISVMKHPGNKFVDGKVRKLSMTVLLNDNFEGGEFEMMYYNKGKSTIHKPFTDPEAGQIIVFPSCEEHRVKPVKRGVRHSLVVWFLGPPMK